MALRSRRRTVLTVIAIKLLITVVVVGLILILRNPTDYRVSDAPNSTVSTYGGSHLQLLGNGNFYMEIFRDDVIIFSAVGTFTRHSSYVTLHYIDAASRTGVNITRDHSLVGTSQNLPSTRNTIRFELAHVNILLYFR
ncbi:MAG: hypothetical protein FWE38_01570 [Firmicutes bacterium]|nr:hypothetical protein [Bacillota bacterium]